MANFEGLSLTLKEQSAKEKLPSVKIACQHSGWLLGHTIFELYNRITLLNEKVLETFSCGARAGNSLIGFPSESLVFCPKMSDSLIRSFLVSDLSDSLMIAHFHRAMWANCSWLLFLGEQPERFAHIAHFWWATWAIPSNRSEEMSDRERIAHIAHQKRGNERFARFSIIFCLNRI